MREIAEELGASVLLREYNLDAAGHLLGHICKRLGGRWGYEAPKEAFRDKTWEA